MKKGKFVFVVIKGVVGMRWLDLVYVSTSLRGVCRESGLGYWRIAKRWERRDEGIDRIWEDSGEIRWVLMFVGLDKVVGRGGEANFRKKATEGFRGYRGEDGRLHDRPVRGKMMMVEEPENKWKPGDPG